jgi:transcriptional regulator GlxA family with amidase domain
MRISLIALERGLTSSITIPMEMLYAARTISQVGSGSNADLELAVAAVEPGPVNMAGGLQVQPTATLQQLAASELVFIPSLWGSPLKNLRRSPALLDSLIACHRNGGTLCSLGTGSFFLAESGLLDGRNATTHWYYFDLFQARYPRVKLDRKRFITLDNRLYCTGSVNAARDVALHLVEQIFGETIAGEIAKQFTHEIKRSYESMLLSYQQQNIHHDEKIIEIQVWLQNHYQDLLRVDDLADRFGMSVRSLNRRFRAAAGRTPLQYLQRIRIDQAKALLKQSNLTITEVGYAVGYQDPSYFAGLFKKQCGITPVEYRQLVRSKLFKVED